MSSDIVIAGVGMVPFKKPGQSDSYDAMGENAARAALQDAGLSFSLIEQAFCGYVYGDSCAGQAALYRLDINGIPIFNVNNNCASGSSAFALATQAVESGNAECALALGFEEMCETGAVLVEWAEKVLDIFPDDYLRVDIEPTGDTARTFSFCAVGPRSVRLLRAVRD